LTVAVSECSEFYVVIEINPINCVVIYCRSLSLCPPLPDSVSVVICIHWK